MGSGEGRGSDGELNVGVATRPLVALLGSLRDELEALEPDQVPARDAADLVEVLDRIERLVAAGKALAAGRVAESSLWSRGGHRSAAHWMSKVCGVTVGDAVRMLNLADTVADAPTTRQAFSAGKLSGRQADTVGRAEKADPAAGRKLAEAAPKLSMGELQTEANRIIAAASSETPEQAAARHRRSRRFRHGMNADGMGWGAWLLPPAEHTRAVALIEGEQTAVFTRARAAGDRDTSENYAADALCAVLDRATDRRAGKSSGPMPTAAPGDDVSGEPTGDDWSFAKVLVIADLAALDRGHVEPGERCEVAGQGPVPAAHVWRMIDGDAFVAAITTQGTEISKVVHLGRRPTALQRTALDYLSGGVCSIDGCNSSARLETDHVADWALTHRTELRQLAPACGHHHDLKTHHGYRFGPLQPNGKRKLIPPDDCEDGRPPDGTGPPDLTIVEGPPPTSPPAASSGATAADGQAVEPPQLSRGPSARPSSLQERARAIGRGDQGAFFDTA